MQGVVVPPAPQEVVAIETLESVFTAEAKEIVAERSTDEIIVGVVPDIVPVDGHEEILDEVLFRRRRVHLVERRVVAIDMPRRAVATFGNPVRDDAGVAAVLVLAKPAPIQRHGVSDIFVRGNSAVECDGQRRLGVADDHKVVFLQREPSDKIRSEELAGAKNGRHEISFSCLSQPGRGLAGEDVPA